jgi:uncharacterized membrane protein YozB (DUF420 family)
MRYRATRAGTRQMDQKMQTALNILIIVACAAVGIILFLGFWNMIKGGDGNTSQKLMRMRVIAQAVAILLLMGALFFFGRGSPG